MQFLPTGTDKEQVLQALLAGNNFHFGNPFMCPDEKPRVSSKFVDFARYGDGQRIAPPL